MLGSPTSLCRAVACSLLVLPALSFPAGAAPTAVNDSYSVAEDTPLVVSNAPLIDATFDGGGGAGGPVTFNGNWSFLDQIENQNGANEGYPVDGAGNAWNSVAFNVATSTIGPWGSGAMPLQGGGVDGFPGAPNVLAGIAAAGNGQNLVTTYLFRNTFTLTAAQVAIANWTARVLVDDSCVVYINGAEVDRINLPGGALTTTSFASGTGDENNYQDRALALGGRLVAGTNVIAIEVHQVDLGSSDVGIDLTLSSGSTATDGFAYNDDYFGTNIPGRAAGDVAATGGFGGSAGLNIEVGRGNFFEGGAKSGAWTRGFGLEAAGTVEVSFRYRLANSDGLDPDDYSEVILQIDGTRYGSAANNSVAHLDDGGDTGWQLATRSIPLSAGNHTLVLGLYNNQSRRNDEFANVWFDDVKLQFSGGAGGVLENDTGTAPVTALLVGTTVHGTLNFSTDGTFSYQPALNFFGTDTFTYRAVDGSGSSNLATVTITVDPVNDAPVVVAKGYAATEDIPLSVPAGSGLLVGASDVENQALTVALAAQASNGAAVVNADGSFTYTPDTNFFGTDTFSYSASDGLSASAPATVTITISAADDAPIANADSYQADENIPLVISESGSGDVVFSTTFDGGAVPELSGGGAAEGVAGYAGLGPAGNQFGGQFWRNPTGLAGNGVQTPTVLTLTNLPPHTSLSIEFLLAVIDTWDGVADSFSSDTLAIQLDGVTVFRHYLHSDPSRQSYVAPAGGLLSSGSDLAYFDGGNDSAYNMALEAALRDLPHSASSATITFAAGGSNWDGGAAGESWAMDNLTVSVSDSPREIPVPRGSSWSYLDDGSDQGVAWRAPGFDSSSWATGNAKLGYGDGDEATTVGFGPDANNKFVTTYFRKSFTVANPAVFSNLLVTVRHDDGAAVYLNGTEIIRTNLVGGADSGEFAPVTMPNEIEANYFSHTVDPSLLVAGTNVIAVEVHQASGSSSDLGFDFSLAGIRSRSAGGVLANDLELDGETLSATLVTNAAHGNVSLASDGTFTYTPGVNFHGTDTFTYAASDGSSSSEATVTITVNPGPNDIPETLPDSYNGTEDQTLVVSAANGVLSNDSDPDLEPLTAVLHTQAANGIVTLNLDGSFSYVPNPNFAGSDSFRYVANDTIDNSQPTLVTLTIANVADRPVANNDVYVAQPGQVLSVPAAGVLANDTDADSGTTLSAVLDAEPFSGVVNLAANGGFTYTPAGGFSGTVSFSYFASDGGLQSAASATVVIHVNARPTAVADSYLVVEDNSLVVSAPGVLGNDTDPERASLSALLVSNPAHGTLALAANGSFTYTPAADYSGPDSFSYAARDGIQNSNTVVVSISVSAVNDAPVGSEDSYTILAGSTANISAADGVLANDIDVDGPSLSATLGLTTSSGVLALAADGSFVYTPAADFTGVDLFTYTAGDGTLSSEVVTVTLAVGLPAESIVISEIMYHPASENDLEEFVELHNIGDAAINLGGWQFTSGLSFTLPAVSVPPGGYLVVAADTAAFTAAYGAVPQLVGGWTGGLSNRGERLRLVDSTGNESDDITYSDQGDWAQRRQVTDGGELGWTWFAAHDGGGSSLELINPQLSNKNGQNWAPSSGAPTPGAANSVAAEDIAPLISDVKHRPAVPRSTDRVTITAKLKDVDGSALGATLQRRISTASPGAFSNIPMFDDGLHGDGEAGDGEFGIILNPSPNGTISEFYIRATDGTNTRTWPAPTNTGQNANALFQVDDEDFTAHYPIYRTIITQPDEDRFPFNNRDSNAELNATFIADNCGDLSVRYQAGMRIRGASSRQDTPPPTRLNVPTDNPWAGETRLNLNTQFTWLQFIGMKFFQASGLPAPDTKRVAMRRNGVDQSEQGQEGYGSIVHVQPLQEEFLDTHTSDAGGNLYKKVRPDVDWAFRNGNVNSYLNDGWNKQTNASENDWSDLNEWLRVMNQAPGSGDYIAQVEAVVNLDQWMRWFAVMTIINNGETNASNGTDDDYSIYRGIADTRFIFIPHDLDTILGQGDGSTITDPQGTIFDMIERGDTLGPLIPLFQNPGILTRYYTALRQQLQTTFSAAEFNALLDNHLTGWVPANTIAAMKTYMDQRRAYITGLVDAQLGAPPAPVPGTTVATVTSAHGTLYINEVLADNLSAYNVGGTFPDAVELRNTGASAVSLAGMSLSDDPATPARYVFPAGSSIAAGAHFVIDATVLGFGLDADGDFVLLYDAGGSLLDSVQFGLQIPDRSISRTGAGANTWALTTPTLGTTNAGASALGNPDTLRINEWLVRPQITFDRDFVELYNPDPLAVALGGLVITDEPVAAPQRHSVPPLSFISGGGFALLYPVGGGAFSPGNASELPFKLAADFGWLSIAGSNGVEIDEVHYICQRNDIAFGRETDGAVTIVDFDLPTPGFSNGIDLSAESVILNSLRITEIMYHPTGDGLLEYLRLKNVGSSTINLGGIRLSSGVTIDLPATDLAPGQEAVVVRDQVAYIAAYGPGGVLGQYSGALSNAGERLRLEIASLGYGILDFSFKDGWYPLTDGLGASLGIVDERAPRASWSEKASWQALGGDAFSYDGWVAANFTSNDPAIIGRDADPDGDGIANGAEYGLGLDPNSGDRADLLGVAVEGNFLTLTYPRSTTATAQWQVQAAGDLENWLPGPTEVMLSADGSIEIWKATDTVPITVGRKRFMRVQITVP